MLLIKLVEKMIQWLLNVHQRRWKLQKQKKAQKLRNQKKPHCKNKT